MNLLKGLLAEANQLLPRLIEIRRHLHGRPELSGQEAETAAYLQAALAPLDLPFRCGIGRSHGFTADLSGPCAGPVVALRADMDAIAVSDQKDVPYRSQRAGVCHACGHDVHMTALLGAAMLLKSHQQHLAGTVRLLFQPAEEVAPGGALQMLEGGALDGVDAIMGLHCWPHLAAGKIGVREGPMLASADTFTLTIHGRGGHAARPHQTVDAIWIAAQLVTALYQMLEREVDPLRPAVLTVGSIFGGKSSNVIADTVEMTGTVRAMDEGVRRQIAGRMKEMIAAFCGLYGATFGFDYQPGSPVLVNDPHITRLVEGAARGVLGPEEVEWLPEPSMGGEDFAWYLTRVPGAMFRLGTRQEGYDQPLHHPGFDVPERVLAVGAAVMAASAMAYLQESAASQNVKPTE